MSKSKMGCRIKWQWDNRQSKGMKKKVREAVFEIELEITKTDNDNIKKRQLVCFLCIQIIH